MFQRKRQLKKEKSKNKFKIIFAGLFFLLFLFVIFEYVYFSFSFGRINFISPLAKDSWSRLSNLQGQFDKANVKYASMADNSDGSFIVKLTSGGDVTISTKKDVLKQISSLQLILSRLTIEGKKLKTLDFRFDNPVVTF